MSKTKAALIAGCWALLFYCFFVAGKAFFSKELEISPLPFIFSYLAGFFYGFYAHGVQEKQASFKWLVVSVLCFFIVLSYIP